MGHVGVSRGPPSHMSPGRPAPGPPQRYPIAPSPPRFPHGMKKPVPAGAAPRGGPMAPGPQPAGGPPVYQNPPPRKAAPPMYSQGPAMQGPVPVKNPAYANTGNSYASNDYSESSKMVVEKENESSSASFALPLGILAMVILLAAAMFLVRKFLVSAEEKDIRT